MTSEIIRSCYQASELMFFCWLAGRISASLHCSSTLTGSSEEIYCRYPVPLWCLLATIKTAKKCLEIPQGNVQDVALENDIWWHLSSCYHNSDPEIRYNVRGWIYKFTYDDFSEKESILSNFSYVCLYLSPTHYHTAGDLSYLLFHCKPRGLSVYYYLFFSSPASSLPSHFLSLMILQSVSLVFLFFKGLTSWYQI